METYVITRADLELFFQWMALISMLPYLMWLLFRLGNRLIESVFQRYMVRQRMARRFNRRFVLDSYRWWVTYRRDQALDENRNQPTYRVVDLL
ncbi:hypothetical protein [Pseudogulbenkiania sp. MAI-1]|uniref:hypothetical protein n=1 Tax=Pseudogulbenkiania sp. MAI-1 TaxID=990370 RepID=UPI00045EC277|nr:hypothetical protein [Pseudogulbenkiania sp. MAI-1]